MAKEVIKKIKKWRPKTTFLIVVVAVVSLEATALVQYYFSNKGIKEEASLRAKGQLDATTAQIMDIVNQVESSVRNTEWIASWAIENPDSLGAVSRRLVQDNPVIVGSTIAMVPGYYKDKPLCSPYYFQDFHTKKLIFKTLATEEYDYPSQEWFKKPMELGHEYWSEPYIDEGGGDILMTTYSFPIRDVKGDIAAILTADISLDWLTEIIEGVQVYNNSFGLLVSREGQIMVAPAETLVMKKNINEVAQAKNEDSADFMRLNQALLSGERGSMQIVDKGVKNNVYFSPIDKTGWAISVVIPDREVFKGLRKVSWLVKLMQFLGLAMILLIIRLATKNLHKLQALNQKKERMENELQIGREIQMSMIPKTFPPFPERKDIDMYAAIVPAKEVSGDLYDYFIRDEKLFFCVGDVSGKGVPASLVMAVTRSLFRSVCSTENYPAEIVSKMNDSLADTNESDMFVTFFCGVLDLPSGVLYYCNAGHNAPMLLSGKKELLSVYPNLPLGIEKGFQYKAQELELKYDDALFLYTDGLTEAENLDHEQFGEERMKAVLHPRTDAQQHLENMQKAVAEFIGNAPQSDDLTMLFIHYKNIKPHEQNWKITIHNDTKELSLITNFVKDIVKEKKIEESVGSNINLAVEEAVSNIVNYAYEKGVVGKIVVEAFKHSDSLEFILSDSGIPFDPTAVEEVDTSLDAKERSIGGLGIHLYKSIMDKVVYTRKDNMNILSLTKYL